ncbi:MAG: hypothetical protein K1X44_08465 [Alphaproteobacteria bacterium]|nr:hypothetical protein [Alphaproteobacteria bacterium]
MQIVKNIGKKILFSLIGIFFILQRSQIAEAHVQWFSEPNMSEKLPSFAHTITIEWIVMAAIISCIVFCAVCVDRFIGRQKYFQHIYLMLNNLKPWLFDMFRIALGFFLISLWILGGIILTPELKTNQNWIPWFQLILALSLIHRKSSFIAGFGIIFLYFYAMNIYGVFNLLNYVIFLGVALFVITCSLDLKKLQKHKYAFLQAGTIFTLMWASIEKFTYMNWYDEILHTHSHIMFGMDPYIFMLTASFFEFSLPFIMLIGNFASRLAALPIMVMFILAVIDFGKIDLIGHSVMIACLVALVITGPTELTQLFRRKQTRSLPIYSGMLVGAHYALLGIFFILYYVVHYTQYGV